MRVPDLDDTPDYDPIPEDAHLIVIRRHLRWHAPDEFPEEAGTMLVYDRGDELPAEGETMRRLEQLPRSLALVNDDAELLVDPPEDVMGRVHEALRKWESGDSFRAPEWEPGDGVEEFVEDDETAEAAD